MALKTYVVHFILPSGLPAAVRVQTPLRIATPGGVDLLGRKFDTFGVRLNYLESGAAPGGHLRDLRSLITYVQELAKLSPAV
ncbi:MAG TPA: hypothetical protein VGH72_33610 [Pseudonocardia sp.]|jgi:hypothetical protein